MNNCVVAVIVTFNSEISRLEKLINLLLPQCKLIVIDNSTELDKQTGIRSICIDNFVEVYTLENNYGISCAQNIGIKIAKKNGATDILLMDDDSLPSADLVLKLLEIRNHIDDEFVVLTPRAVSIAGINLSNRSCTTSELIFCSELMSSGSLVSVKIFELVGLFDESLFIDCVDFEWGWRALKQGVKLFICNNVHMEHRLGTGTRCGMRVASPIRHYYQYRNVLKMIFKNKYTPFSWRLIQCIKLPIKFFLIFLLLDEKKLRLSFARLGILDFLRNKYGKL